MQDENDEHSILIDIEIPESFAGQRIDAALAKLLPDYSRERIKGWIKSGECLLDNKVIKPNHKVQEGEQVRIVAKLEDVIDWSKPEANIDFDVIFEDEHLIVVNKPVGLVVHPGAGNLTGTLVNGLLYRYPELKLLPRAGIVHRIDKDTTGLLLVAKTIKSHKELCSMMQSKKIRRSYSALVYGEVISGRKIDAPIGRSRKDRVKMAVVNGGRDAVTNFIVAKRFSKFSLLDVSLETGRTHQIRVHLSHEGYPIVGDHTYAGKRLCPISFSKETQDVVNAFSRQALHAYRLEFEHPMTKEVVRLEAPLPVDMKDLIGAIGQG